jgi:hypothetical protein
MIDLLSHFSREKAIFIGPTSMGSI